MIDETLRVALEEMGVSVARVALKRPGGGLIHGLGSPGNDLYQAACLVFAAENGLRRVRPRAIIYSSSHAALLQPPRTIREAVWVDGPIALMRPGVRNIPIRKLERVRQRRLDLGMAMSLQDPDALLDPLQPRARVALHVPVGPSRADPALPAGLVPPFGVMYAGTPGKKGLDLAIDAWRLAAVGHELVVTGISSDAAMKYLKRRIGLGVHFVGPVPRDVHRAIVRRAALYLSASRREEYGTAQLEALADRIPLVSVPSLGAAEPVAVARRVGPELLALDMSAASLALCIQRAVSMTDTQLEHYRARAQQVMAAYSYSAFKDRLASGILPLLLG